MLADAVTSLAAIFALLTGKYLGWQWMDPAMGVAGSLLVARWSVGLLRETSHVLLDHQAARGRCARPSAQAVEGDGADRIADLHVWTIGPGLRAAAFQVLTDEPHSPEVYHALIPAAPGRRARDDRGAALHPLTDSRRSTPDPILRFTPPCTAGTRGSGRATSRSGGGRRGRIPRNRVGEWIG